MRHDLISDALSAMKNAEIVGKYEVAVVGSKLLKAILSVLERAGYIGQVRESGQTLHVQLVGKINALKAVRPRFAVQKDEFEKFEKRYLPSRNIGLIVVSTSQGIMTHREAIERGIGGRLLAYVY